MEGTIVPGAYVRHPAQPDWGVGQVQSVDGHRVTVNIDHVGKYPQEPPEFTKSRETAKFRAGESRALFKGES